MSSDSNSEDETKNKNVKEINSSESSEEEDIFMVSAKEKQADSMEEQMSSDLITPLPLRKRFIPKYDVEGVYKVVLGEETQLEVELLVGVDVSIQYPWKTVAKSKIMENIEIGGELSQFFSVKDQLEIYKDNYVLLGYIADESSDVDEFYICCTIAARDHCKQQSDKFIRRQEKKLEKAVYKKPRPWKGLGSEAEIKRLRPVKTRPLMEIEIKAKFPTEYQPEKFTVRDADGIRDCYIELTPYRQKFNNVFRRRIDAACQAAAPTVNGFAQTELRYPKNMWTQSIADTMGKVDDFEGSGDAGQDKDIDDEKRSIASSATELECETKEKHDDVGLAAYKAAFRRMRRPSYIKMINSFMNAKTNEVDSVLELNTVMDMYCNDYPYLATRRIADIYGTMLFEEYVCFTDIRAKDKYVSCAVFHPMWSGIVAISYSDGSPTVIQPLTSRPDPIHRAVYGLNPVMLWSHIDSLIPKLYLKSHREVKVLSFCPFDENLLLGGCINGQVILWDLTNKLENVERIEVLSETKEKYRIAMYSHMDWMKQVHDKAVVSATAMSNLITSHYGAVTSIRWLSPNFTVSETGRLIPITNGNKSLMIFTGSEDGTILIWNLSPKNIVMFEAKKVKTSKRVPKKPSGLLVDISPYKVLDRNLQPYFKIVLGMAGQPQVLPVQSLGVSRPIVKYTHAPRNTGTGRKYFNCKILPQNENEMCAILYASSQHGELRQVTWEGHPFNTGEVVNSEYCETKYSCNLHDGIISATHKNPFLKTITLTVGGKIFAIWSDDLAGRPLVWKKRPCRLTDGAWSLYKPSILFISTSEGDLETWDLLLRSNQPISIQTLSGTQLTGVSLHTLPLPKNIIGVSDISGSFRMFLNPPIYMIHNTSYLERVESMILRELKMMHAFISWQNEWLKNNPHIILERKRKEGAFLAIKEEEKRKLREEEQKRLEDEAEAKRQARMRVIGPEERWQMIVQKLIERTIAVKKRINRAELIEHEKPLRDLEIQRLEKEKRMLEIMKNQKTIFNDTVAILFPEALQKEKKTGKSYLSDNKDALKKDHLDDYEYLKDQAMKTVVSNPYKVTFCWDSALAEGKERRQALCANEDYINMHKVRLLDEFLPETVPKSATATTEDTLSQLDTGVDKAQDEFIEN